MADHTLPSITPFLRYNDPATAVDWLAQAFGLERTDLATGDDGAVVHAELRWGDCVVHIGPAGDFVIPSRSPSDLPFTSGGIHLDLGDAEVVDDHFKQVVEAGAEVLVEPHDTFYGARNFAVRDLERHIWSFGGNHKTQDSQNT